MRTADGPSERDYERLLGKFWHGRRTLNRRRQVCVPLLLGRFSEPMGLVSTETYERGLSGEQWMVARQLRRQYQLPGRALTRKLPFSIPYVKPALILTITASFMERMEPTEGETFKGEGVFLVPPAAVDVAA